MAHNYINFHCPQGFHFFAKRYEGEDVEIQAYHSDNTLCESAEFNITELLEDDLPSMGECPWCLKVTTDTEHIRKCSNWKPLPKSQEILDAYSEPCAPAKREGMLRMIEMEKP